MAKNAIQFQPGMSLPAFLERYGTEAQCREALMRMRWPGGFRCPHWGMPATANCVGARCSSASAASIRPR